MGPEFARALACARYPETHLKGSLRHCGKRRGRGGGRGGRFQPAGEPVITHEAVNKAAAAQHVHKYHIGESYAKKKMSRNAILTLKMP